MIVFPAASTRTASPGTSTADAGPTALIRLPSTTIVPSAITSSPFMVTMRALVNATFPFGLVRGTVRVTTIVSRFSCFSGFS